jgi:2-phospho-L-lactate guanylyltransferase
MRAAAILPVKHFAQAKRRLGASIDGELRDELAQAMVGDVLVALSETASIERTIVVTREDSVAEAARRLGALIVCDTAEQSQSAAVALGVTRALADGFERALCIPGDCPALDPGELNSLLDASDAPGVVIVPDRHGTGTNGLLLCPPDAIAPSFGPDSRERHTALAVAAGVSWRIAQPASLLLDIDTGEDLAVLRERLTGDRSSDGHDPSPPRRTLGARRTRAVLDRATRRDRPIATTPV